MLIIDEADAILKIGFEEEMLYIEIDENSYKDKLYIDVSDVEKHQKQSF